MFLQSAKYQIHIKSLAFNQSVMIINKLSQATAEQLCAQQVITSLPDCIKELVDNSIDASSTYIKIILHEYGKTKIEVIDNGLGISDFDFLGKKGSTSKNKGNDQFNYLGFRGEAVHSIGRVSAGMTIQSKSSVDGYRRIFKVHTNQLQVFKEQRLCHGQFNFQITNLQNSRNTGTKVTIDDIFSKLPVRRIQLHAKYKQFLKKTNQLIKEYCLIYPEIQFIFINTRQKKPEIIIETTCLKIFNRANWLERIKQLDDRIGNSLVYINGQFFEGFVLNKIQSGSSRENNFIKKNYHYLYLNKRPIDIINVLLTTLNEIYKKYNNNTKYAFILNLKLKHEMMDVNLTPNKREVFIRKEILEKIVKELKEKIVQKVIQDIPTLSNFEDKRKTTQNQQRFSTWQPSIMNHFTQRQVQPSQMRKTVSFASQFLPNTTDKNQQIRRQNQNSKTDNKFSNQRDNINEVRNSFHQNLNQKIQESKKQVVINKCSKLSFDLPQLPKVNVNMNKIKQNLNNIFSINRDSMKRVSVSSEDIKITLPHTQKNDPVNQSELQSIRKENQDKKIRQQSEDAKKRTQFLKEVKIQYNEDQNPKRPKLTIENYKQSITSSRTRENKPKQNLMQQDIRRRQLDDESYFQQLASLKQSQNDQIQEIPNNRAKSIQPNDKSLENRIKAKINIDMSQIFTNFNKNKNLSQEKALSEINYLQGHQNYKQPYQNPDQSQNCAHNQIIIEYQQQISQPLKQEALMIDGKGNIAKKSIRKENFRDFEIIGQFNMGFILCLYNYEYFLVDQHAASQKFHYQRFLNKSERLQSIKSEESQNISGIEADQIEDSKILLTEAGFFYKIIGRNRLQLERCPVFYQTKLGLDYFWQIVEEKKQLHRISKFTAMCAMKACKTAVVVGNALRYNQMKKIVTSLADLESPWNCPHGRPTLVQLGKRQVFRGKVILGKSSKKYDL